ncbi:hypothetical protein [Chenggangzhangella methanolivorans]|uniref:DUF2946 domain-containing protein n=1 Tax=Chenggangzhangella methanolivorans TaxID=1437009 RepID=A0A9E6R6W1_9HYPH|nr:hypothetical protein [Chenggangzhangella methanolivorans]QZN99053.1 hypothetical protein K6K41_19630 [Chenggangzhangella methanolivorans]
MIDRSEAKSSLLGRLFARLTIALCLTFFGYAGAVEKGHAAHVGPGSAIALAITGEAGDQHAGDVDASGDRIDHGCHGCAAMPQPTPHGAAALVAFGERLNWFSAPSEHGREPLIDLPPPRA